MLHQRQGVGMSKTRTGLYGFTIVELLIVIVVIAILAAVTIVAYNGIQSRATASALQSNLNQIAKKLEIAKIDNNAYPASLADIGVTVPSNSSFIYQGGPNGFCLSGANTSSSYRVSNSNTMPSDGSCSGTKSDGTACPAGYIVVPASSTLGTAEFCLMKYEAKNVGGVATSQPDNAPWASISQTTAISTASAACSGCHLMTEAEWMAVAANVISIPSNWLSGTIGSGHFYRGHSDSTPASTLAASSNDADGYFGTDDSGDNQRRTLTLSNGEVIWDLSGNVWEWTQGTIAAGQQPGIVGESAFAVKQWSNASLNWNGFPLSSRHTSLSSLPGLSGIASWSTSQAIGQLNSNYGDATLRAIRRGGTWSDGSSAGIFAVGLGNTPTTTTSGIGFRVAR